MDPDSVLGTKNELFLLRKNFSKLSYKQLGRINLHTQNISQHSSKIAKNNEIRKILKKLMKCEVVN